jgi:hypothetical protein
VVSIFIGIVSNDVEWLLLTIGVVLVIFFAFELLAVADCSVGKVRYVVDASQSLQNNILKALKKALP